MLVAVGCGKSAAERLEEENKNLKADLENRKLMSKLTEDAVGSYERKNEGKTVKIVFRKKIIFYVFIIFHPQSLKVSLRNSFYTAR